MDTDKAKLLMDAGKYDVNCSSKFAISNIYNATTPTGKCPLFKTLMSNDCAYDCKYCSNRGGRHKRTAQYEPEELAKTFMGFARKGLVVGLFLSSAVVKGNPDPVMEKMVESLEILRYKYNFHGYVHLKALPGANYDLIKRGAELSSRMSINIEAPNKQRLNELSSTKEYKSDLLKRQAWIKKLNLREGQTTQMVVGGAEETDFEVLKMMRWEYEKMEMKRVYFSAFRPVCETPLEKREPVPGWREHRLYNTDWLLREYPFKLEEVREILVDEMLPNQDPKMLLAKQFFDSPVDVNEASYEELLRIPGIGPKTAKKLMSARRIDRKALHQAGVILKRADPFIKVNGWNQSSLSAF
jgi:predicted DNA-binding helix-hairpin-helix protein